MSAAGLAGIVASGSRATRKAVLTTHIASAVALLGTTAGLAITGTRTAGSDDFHRGTRGL